MSSGGDRFEYPEDKVFFEDLFGGPAGMAPNLDLFDHGGPESKRTEFNRIRGKVFDELVARYGSACQLDCHPDCTGDANQVDRLIPLSTNVLNKQLRGQRGGPVACRGVACRPNPRPVDQ